MEVVAMRVAVHVVSLLYTVAHALAALTTYGHVDVAKTGGRAPPSILSLARELDRRAAAPSVLNQN